MLHLCLERPRSCIACSTLAVFPFPPILLDALTYTADAGSNAVAKTKRFLDDQRLHCALQGEKDIRALGVNKEADVRRAVAMVQRVQQVHACLDIEQIHSLELRLICADEEAFV